MPIPDQRDRQKARSDLASWLAAKMPAATDLTISELDGPAFTGFSNETLLFDATWRDGGETHRQGMVARVEPTAHTVFLESAFDAQYRVMEILGRETDIPVPPVFWYEDDRRILGAPFFVMGRVDGQIPGDSPPYTMGGWPSEASPEQLEQLWWDALDVMARIHRLDWRSLGLGFVDRPERGSCGLDQQLEYYERYLSWAAGGRPQPVVDRAWQWLVANKPRQTGPDCLCWGDSRIGNMIFDDFRCRAVLDWEMVTPGDPLQDLAWWLFLDRHHSEGLGNDRLAGFPSREATIARWGKVTGRSTADFDWYEMFAGFRFGVVMVRLGQLLVDFELMPPDSDLDRNNPVTGLLEKMLAAA